jgi:hypothetical protein
MNKRIITLTVSGILLFVLFCGLASSAPVEEPEAVDEYNESHSISGYVYESDSSSTIDDAQIEAVNEENKETYYSDTNYEGYYYIELPSGDYEIVIQAPGYEEDYEYVSINGYDESRNFYLTQDYAGGSDGFSDYNNNDNYNDNNYYDEGNNNDYNDGGDYNPDENSEGGDFEGLPSDFENQVQNILLFSLIFILVLIISLITIAASTVAIFVRLGKIKRSLMGEPKQNQQPQYPPPPYHYNKDYYDNPPPPPPPKD